MKITKRQLKRIIREEYSRLKRQGVLREMNEDYSQDEMVTEAISKGILAVLMRGADPYQEAQKQCTNWGCEYAVDYVAEKLAAMVQR